MRISDWSSDVCSSDLLARGPHQQAHPRAVLAGAQGAVRDPPGGTVPGQVRRRRQLHDAQRGWFAPRHLLRQHLRPADPQDLRSEEHTSELQSLMRISYAVFCLQKKKITIKNNTNPQ